jgi:hypothetical protein
MAPHNNAHHTAAGANITDALLRQAWAETTPRDLVPLARATRALSCLIYYYAGQLMSATPATRQILISTIHA